MAPQLALDRLPNPKQRKLRILDPMMGSGTIPVLAALNGHRAVGFDVDPLALLIARTWARPLDPAKLRAAAKRVVQVARCSRRRPTFPDDETHDFVDYWFDAKTQLRLARLSSAIKAEPPTLHNPLWCAFSRLIIAKDAGVSRARDVSHSRPHRVRDTASFDPIDEYQRAVEIVIRRHLAAGQRRPAETRLQLSQGDARCLPLRSNAVDAILTSPPYLQAIDYLRGHRLSLVWMGYDISALREMRGTSIGSERGLRSTDYIAISEQVTPSSMSARGRRILTRYVDDLGHVTTEAARVLRPGGVATFVVAEATLEGKPIKISAIVKQLMENCSFTLESQFTRPLMTDRRYLPPPTSAEGTLDRRMREEHCLTFKL